MHQIEFYYSGSFEYFSQICNSLLMNQCQSCYIVGNLAKRFKWTRTKLFNIVHFHKNSRRTQWALHWLIRVNWPLLTVAEPMNSRTVSKESEFWSANFSHRIYVIKQSEMDSYHLRSLTNILTMERIVSSHVEAHNYLHIQILQVVK